jgi:2-polyprenyl-3-methyl-5-hydroxy-6-metoxy-1,4-benzoquinol methylase
MSNYRQHIYEHYVSGFQGIKVESPLSSSTRWAMAYQTYLRGWLPSDKTARILDVGCGSGNLLRYLKNLGYQSLHGVDISPEQVALARQVASDVVQGNVFDYLDSASGQFDLIIGLDLVEHFDKDEVLRFLAACRQALRPGGRIILQTPNAESPWACSIRYGDFTHEVCFSPRLLARLLEMSGCRSVEAREAGPVLRCGPSSAVRWLLWKFVRVPMIAWNIIETGSAGSGVFTRVFLISAVRA